jgi:UDP-galactopyranose mutase
LLYKTLAKQFTRTKESNLFEEVKYLIVGAGLWGTVLAERIANDFGKKVTILDKLPHIGGISFSTKDSETNIEYHVYGTHIFHTSNEKVWKYINQFTEFNGYNHQVLATYKNKVYQLPINLETINSFYGINLKPYQAKEFLVSEAKKEKIYNPCNLEEKAISLIGRPLYEAFIRGYTEKQWEKECRELPANIIERLPVRFNYNESYYIDRWQGIPLGGYGRMFERMLRNKLIDVRLNTDFFDVSEQIPRHSKVFYSGPIDRYFSYKYGKLEWRSLKFERAVISVEDFQGTSVMNYPEKDIEFTRIHEPKHLHPERKYDKDKTLILREYPKNGNRDNLYYPVNTNKNQNLLKKYEKEIAMQRNIIFGGRLGEYKYYDMDQTIASALKIYDCFFKKEKT